MNVNIDSDRRTFVLQGISAAPGLAQGPTVIYHRRRLEIPRLSGFDPEKEHQRLQVAIRQSQHELAGLRDQLVTGNHPAEAKVFDAHILMLEDTSLLAKVDDALKTGVNAEAAWMDAILFFASQLEAIPDATWQARAGDLRDAGNRVLSHLLGRDFGLALSFQEPSIVIADDLAPSETATMDKSMVSAFCTATGGPTSHTAILAKALGIPAVVGLGDSILKLQEGVHLLVDGGKGEVIVRPGEQELRLFRQRFEEARRLTEREMAVSTQPARTTDGHQVEVVANIGNPQDVPTALQHGAEGIGLLRTEFLFLERKSAPSEAEQQLVYRQILESMRSLPVVVRTIDVGGDKEIPYLDLGQEDNPFLGWRAIRMCLDQPEFFKVQLRALWRASPGTELRVMFPMIASLDEIRRAKALLQEAREEVLQAGGEVAETIQVGIMIEIPSAAILAEQFAREVDFFSIGTNDLTQYTMAADRTNPKVAHLADACHPAVLRLIQMVISAGHTAGIWVGVCGELAGDEDAIPVLLGMELDEFSMAPRSISHAKALIRGWSLESARQLATQALRCDSAEAVRQLVRSKTSELGIE